MGFWTSIINGRKAPRVKPKKKTEKETTAPVLGDGYTFRDKNYNTICIRQIGDVLCISVTEDPKNGKPGARVEMTLDADGVAFTDEFLKSFLITGSIGSVLSVLDGGRNK